MDHMDRGRQHSQLTRREALASGGALIAGAIAIAHWPLPAYAAPTTGDLSPSQRESYAAAVDVLADVDPLVNPGRFEEVWSAFASDYRELSPDQRQQVDYLLDTLDGPQRGSFAGRGKEKRLEFLRAAVGGFDGRRENALRSSQIGGALDLISRPFYPSGMWRRGAGTLHLAAAS
jgi:hypothetical protein